MDTENDLHKATNIRIKVRLDDSAKDWTLERRVLQSVSFWKEFTTANVIIKNDFRGINTISPDQQKMRQVFLNIGLNAVESLPGGGDISISTRNEKGFAIVSIRDTRTGIAREHLKEIFYPFFTTKEQGTGLGLSIANRIIEEHRGKSTLKSSPGIGSTFEVFIPLHQPVHPRTRNAVSSAALSP